MSQLEKIVKLTKAQYETLTTTANHTITYSGGTHTYSDNNLYFVTDETVSSDDLGEDFLLDVPHGGTGKDSFTVGSVLIGNGTAALTELAATSLNIANTIIKRDANGAFSSGLITAGTLDGGQHIFNGNVQLNAQSGSYNEGLRINRSTTGYANIYLGGSRSSASGNQSGGWWIGTLSTPANATATGSTITNTVFTISQDNTDDGFSIKGTRGATRVTNSGWAIKPRLAVGTTYQTGYTFYANGTSYLNGVVTSTDNIIISKAATTNDLYVQVGNTSKSKQVELLIGGASGNAGIYDRTKGKWIAYSDTNGNVVLNGNANSATEFSSAASVTLTGDVTGTASSKKGWSISTTIANGAVTNAKLENSSIVIAGVTASLGGSVSLEDMGLSTAMHFKGTVTAVPTATATATFNTYEAGDVILGPNNKEYVYKKGANAAGSNWIELGSESSFKVKQTAITSTTGTAETTAVTNFLYSFAQDADGVVSVKNRPLPIASTSVTGIVQLGTGATQAAQGNHTHSASDVGASASDHGHGNIGNGGTLGSTASYGVATDANKKIIAIDLAVSAPNASGTATVFVSSVTQSSQGKISVARANLPVGTTSVTGIVQLGTGAAQAAKGDHSHTLSSLGAAASSHDHGNILSGGTISTSATIATNDTIVISTTANSGKVTKAKIVFNTANTSKVLSQAGTWVDLPTNSDTKNTAGASATATKIFLVGAISQSTSAQTYSNTAVYATNGAFSAKTLGVNADSTADKVTLQWNATDLSLDFVFA